MKFPSLIPLATFVLTVTLFSHYSMAKQPIPIKLNTTNQSISVDADLSEPAWKNATKISVNNVTRPYDNTPSPVKTTALMLENSNTLYIAFIAKDPHPEQIRAYFKDRDKAWGDDIVGIKLDTYNDQRTAYRFMVNALGVQIDGIESEITKKESDAWDGIWDSAGKITKDGYIVEMALPLRMLNFKEKNSLQTWGFELVRFYPRDDFMRISNIRLERGNGCEICQLATFNAFSNAKQGDNLIITPSVVAGANEDKEDDNWQRDNNIEPSLDMRWGITPDLLMNATLNPDFSTVEADHAKLNINNNFALFFPEKRAFFLDNADYFDSNYNLVYTRNINAPNYGVKVTGRYNDHSIGIFFTDDDSTHFLIPGNRSSSIAEITGSSQAGALRYRYNYNENITLGWINTLRTANNYQNLVSGFDARFRLSTEDVFKFQTLLSSTEYPDDLFQQFCDLDDENQCIETIENQHCEFGACDVNENTLRTLKKGTFSGNAFRAGYYHTDRDWYYTATFEKQNSNFRGDLGFISKVDQQQYGLSIKKTWYGEPEQWWSYGNLGVRAKKTLNDNNENIEDKIELNARISGAMSTRFGLDIVHKNKVGRRLNQSILAIENNTHRFNEDTIHLGINSKPWADVEFNTNLTVGKTIDYSNDRLADSTQLRQRFKWNINKHWETQINHTVRKLDADDANVFIARLTDFRSTYQFSIQSFVRLSLIYNNTSKNPYNYLYIAPEDITENSKNLSTELLYAYKINAQTVFYLGYSDNRSGEYDFSNLEQNQRSIFMKFSYAWIK